MRMSERNTKTEVEPRNKKESEKYLNVMARESLETATSSKVNLSPRLLATWSSCRRLD